jgi:hypothetical protein
MRETTSVVLLTAFLAGCAPPEVVQEKDSILLASAPDFR